MAQVHAKIRALEEKVEFLLGELAVLKNSGVKRRELVERAREIPKEITQSISDEIRKDYDAINTAIQKLDQNRPDYGDLKHKLQELKKDVPYIYKLPKDLQKSIIEEINKILGINRSD